MKKIKVVVMKIVPPFKQILRRDGIKEKLFNIKKMPTNY
jgi:hypothetical protein